MTPGALPGRLIGSGRAADVYEIEANRVLRRYRVPFDVSVEASLMTYLRASGYPVPEVFEVNGSDLVMERLHGPGMLADLARRPWLAARHGAVLARLHDQLHEIGAPPGLRRLGAGGEDSGAGGTGSGDRVLHLDLHPGNVMLTGDGPVVIDWSNAAAGPPGADVAMATLIMRTSEVDDLPAAVRPVAGLVRDRLVRRFEASVGADARPHLAAIAELRLRDPNVRPGEAERVNQVLYRSR